MFKHIRTLLWKHQQPALKQTSSIASSRYTSPRVPRGNRSPPSPVASSEPSNLVPEHPVPCRIIILLRDWISQKGALDQPKSTNLFKCLFPSSPQGDGQTGSICQSRVHEATCSRPLFFKEGKKWPSPSKPTHHYWIMEYLQTSSNGLFKINLARLVLKGRSAARCPFVTTWSDTRRGTFQQGCFPGRGNYTFIVNGRVASIKSCRGESCENTTVNYLVQQFAFWTLAPTKKSLFIIITLLTTLQKKLFRPFYQKWVSPCRKSHCHRGRLQKLEIHISGSSWLGWPSKLCARTRGQWPTPHSSRRGQESKHIFYWLFQSTFPLIRFPSWKVNIFAPPLGNRS